MVVGEEAGRSNPNWDFEPSSKRELRGDRFMYLVVEKPKKAASVRATFALTVHVVTPKGILGAHLHESLHNRLSQVLCS